VKPIVVLCRSILRQENSFVDNSGINGRFPQIWLMHTLITMNSNNKIVPTHVDVLMGKTSTCKHPGEF
jgi:hypothetical protein